HLVRLDDDPDLAAGLDGVRVLDPWEAGGDVLEPFEALDVALERLASGPWSGGRDRIGGVDDDGEEGLGAVQVVVVEDRVYDIGGLAEAPAQVGSDLGVGALDLAVYRLADVVQQSCTTRLALVHPQLRGDDAGEVGDLHRVLEDVLTVAGAELHAAWELDQAGLESHDVGLESSLVTALPDVVLHVLLGLVDDLF